MHAARRSASPRVLVGLGALVAVALVVAVTVLLGDRTGSGSDPSSPQAGLPSLASNPGAIVPITVSGDRILHGGQPWWFAGYNSFVWSGNCGADDEKMTARQVDAWLASMRHDGHGAVRLFFFEGWDLRRLDAAVASARRYGVYLTVTLDDARGDCGSSRKDAAWFADPAATGEYERHLREVVARYRGEPAIAWFEYFNEPNDAGGALRPFYDRMGAIARGIDPTRLFSSGTVAPYAVGGPDAYRTIHESPGVDIASLHEYDENEDESHHGPEARDAAAGKPVIVGEFGIKSGPGCDDGSRPQRFADKVRAYIDQGYAGALAWAWQPGGGGGGGCEYGNLDTDSATQDVLRSIGP